MSTFVFRVIAVACVMVCFSSGCSTFYYNEGAGRVAVKTDANPVFVGTYISPEQELNDKDIIRKGDAFSIRLMSAYVCDFHESVFYDLIGRSNYGAVPCSGGDGGQSVVTRGEITIMTNIGERTNGTGISFNPVDITKLGRIVYYNEDVRESGQFINAKNLPVFGPQTYHGGPFYMDWSILELDNQENSSMREMLSNLASIGGTAFPSSSPVLGVLNSIGAVLLANAKDDVEMHYQFEFDPQYSGFAVASKTSFVYRMPLKEGYFAILRREKRDALPGLKEEGEAGLTVCLEEGVLCDTDNKPYRGSTWLLLRISREDTSQAAKFDSANDVETALTAIEGNVKNINADAVKTAIDNYIKSRK